MSASSSLFSFVVLVLSAPFTANKRSHTNSPDFLSLRFVFALTSTCPFVEMFTPTTALGQPVLIISTLYFSVILSLVWLPVLNLKGSTYNKLCHPPAMLRLPFLQVLDSIFAASNVRLLSWQLPGLLNTWKTFWGTANCFSNYTGGSHFFG